MAATRDTVRVIGGAQLRRTLRRAGQDLTDLKAANAKAAAFVAALAKASPSAPRRTGRLVGSVRGNRAAGRARIMAGGAAVPYAGPIHWGWPSRNIEAQPFIAAAAEESQPQWLGIYQSEVDDIVDRVKGA